jgi:exopolysaccharide biosynthesis polyprenyl glycosylphosphotransferase
MPQRHYLGIQTLWLGVSDVLCLLMGIFIGISVRLGTSQLNEYFLGHLDGWLLFFGTVILANYAAGSYGTEIRFSRFNLLVNWLFSLFIGIFVLGITSYAWFETLLGRGVLALTVLSYGVFSLITKIILYRQLLRSPQFSYRIAILGTGPLAERIRHIVENKYVLPTHQVTACISLSGFDRSIEGGSAAAEGIPVLEVRTRDLSELVHRLRTEVLIIGFESADEVPGLYALLRRLRFEGVTVLSPIEAIEIYGGRIPLELVNDKWLIELGSTSATRVTMRLKRILDILAVVISCAVTLPVGLLIALLLKISAPFSPVFYKQDRIGRFGRVFRMYKFRTMIDRAEALGGPIWSPRDDARVTRLGRILRRFRLDEIPQMLNILTGSMSLVGPRPERPEFVEALERKIPYYRERENVAPGLTGWAQIRYPYGNSVEDARRKLEYDLYYIKNLSLRLDLQTALRTLRIVLLGMERQVR